MTKHEQQSRMRRRIARGWLAQGKPALMGAIVSVLRSDGPMTACSLQIKIGRHYPIRYIDGVMAAEAARDWRSRRLRPATGYPDGYYISFDTNEDRK